MSSKACKFECGTLIQWDTAKSIFIEADGTPHTKDRCASMKEKKGKTLDSPESRVGTSGKDLPEVGLKDLAAAIRDLAAAIRSRPV